MENNINWFEIPATDFDRALKFYGDVLGKPLQELPMPTGDMKMYTFAMEGMEGVGGALIQGAQYKPSAQGTIVYFHCGNDLQPYLDRVVPAGGEVLVPKTFIREDIGDFAIFADSEGNRVALHSMNPEKGHDPIPTIVDWFEIPAADFNRAVTFYSAVMDAEFYQQEMSHLMMGFFPMKPDTIGVGGAIVYGEPYVPTGDGPKIYLNCGDDLQPYLDRVEPAGGKVVLPKTEISPEYGYFAFFMDTEGNVTGLHSMH